MKVLTLSPPSPPEIKATNIRLYSIIGLMGTSIILIGFILSGWAFRNMFGKRYSILNYYISELGDPNHSEWAIVFNICLIVGGLLLTIFMIKIAVLYPGKTGKWGAILGGITGIGGSLVGIIPLNFGVYHGIPATTFFYGGMISATYFTIVIFRDSRQIIPKWMAYLGVVIIIIYIIFNMIGLQGFSFSDLFVDYHHSPMDLYRPTVFWPIAFFEWLAVLGSIIWILLMALILISKFNNYKR